MELTEKVPQEDHQKENDLKRYSYEEAVDKFGTGRYQLIVCAMLSIVTWSTVSGNTGFIWLGGPMKHTCIPAELYNSALSNFTYVVKPDQCSYDVIVKYNNDTNITTHSNVLCSQWNYDRTFFDSTIVSEWNLNSCNGKWKISLGASLYMIGFLIGCILFGVLSDRYGRRMMFLVSHIGLLLSGVIGSFSVNLVMLIGTMFFFGIFVAGARNSAFVYMAEILAPRWRGWTGPVTSLTYMVMSFLVTGVAQFSRDWRLYLLIVSLVCIWFIPYFWLMFESPQWLLVQGRQKEVVAYFRRSAQINGISIPEQFQVYQHEIIDNENISNFKGFIRKCNIRVITLAISMMWFSVACILFGINYNVGNMTGNIFHNMYLTWSFGPIGFTTLIVIRYGRRLTITTGFIITGLVTIVTAILTSYEHLPGATIAIPLLAGFGSAFTSYSFAGLYVITSEIYATKMRVTALGMGSSFARVGGAVAPFLALSSELSSKVPYILFTAIAVAAAAVSFTVPETKDETLPESITEMEQRFKPIWPCTPGGDKSKKVLKMDTADCNNVE